MDPKEIQAYKEQVKEECPEMKDSEVAQVLIHYMAAQTEYIHQKGSHEGLTNYNKLSKHAGVSDAMARYHLDPNSRLASIARAKANPSKPSREQIESARKNHLKKTNPQLHRLNELGEGYDQNHSYELSEEDLDNIYLLALLEIPEEPDFWHMNIDNGTLTDILKINNKVLKMLETRDFISNISNSPAAVKILQRTEKGSLAITALVNLEQRLSENL